MRYPAAPPCIKIINALSRLFFVVIMAILRKCLIFDFCKLFLKARRLGQSKTTACEKPLFKYLSVFIFEHLFYSDATSIIGVIIDCVNDYL